MKVSTPSYASNSFDAQTTTCSVPSLCFVTHRIRLKSTCPTRILMRPMLDTLSRLINVTPKHLNTLGLPYPHHVYATQTLARFQRTQDPLQ
jgi:hypothetical protein